MTPMGRVHPLDDHTEAIYLFGQSGGRTPGWYVRTRVDGGTGTMLSGPHDSVEAARDSLRPSLISTNSGTYDRTEVEAAFDARWRELGDLVPDPVGVGPAYASPSTYPQWFYPYVLTRGERIFASPTSRVDALVKIEGGEGIYLGLHVHLASFCHLNIGGGRTLLEDGTSCGSGAKLISGSNVPGVGHGCSAIAPDAVVSRSFVWLRKNATVFAGGIVLPGTVVGEGACVAAGAVVLAHTIIPAGEVWGGVPAKRIGVVR